MTYAQSIGADFLGALDVVAVGRSLARRKLLADVTFRVRSGEIFGLIGLNGAGKSTLLKCIVGLAPIDDGSIAIFGVSHVDWRARSRLGYLPERFAPSRQLCGLEFLRFMLAVQGQAYSRASVARMLDEFELSQRSLRQRTAALSKGMVQKLGLAACLLAEKDLYILDEPTSGLDVLARSALKRRLVALRERGRTVLLSTHSLDDVDEVCDRMAVLERGRVVYEGEVQVLRGSAIDASPEKAFLALLGRQQHILHAESGAPVQ